MTTSPSARERTTPGAGTSHRASGTTPAADVHANVPALRSATGDAIVALSWYERMGHAAIFPCGDDDVERLDS
jgi:hypothetical protein